MPATSRRLRRHTAQNTSRNSPDTVGFDILTMRVIVRWNWIVPIIFSPALSHAANPHTIARDVVVVLAA